MRIPNDLLLRIENWRQRQPVVPSLAEAVRRLVDCGLAADPVPAVGPPPTGELPLGAPVPVAKPVRTYAEASIYGKSVRPRSGYPWEKSAHDAFDPLNTRQPKRLIAKLHWLEKQFEAAGKPTTLRKLITDALQEFVDRELKAWRVPPEYLD